MPKLAHWLIAAGFALTLAGCDPYATGGYEPAAFKMGRHHHHGSSYKSGTGSRSWSGGSFRSGSSGGRK